MLVNPKQIILKAQAAKYAIGSFNTSDMEMTKAIIWGAQKSNSPVIVETSEKALAYAGVENLSDIIKNEAKKVQVPVALHLDHGKSLDILRQCLACGYTSVMFDGSHLSFEENKILTRQAVEMAHRYEATCEGELGAIGGLKSKFTDPKEVVEFVRETGVDFLAIGIGSAHGADGGEKLDIELLKKIKSKTKIPLVLHGGSGVSENEIKEAIKNGIVKINIDTDIRHTFSRSVLEISKKYQESVDPRDIMMKIMLDVQNVVEEKIKIFGSFGKAL